MSDNIATARAELERLKSLRSGASQFQTAKERAFMAALPPEFIVLTRLFAPGAAMDFKRLSSDGRFAPFGNFNFGAVGAALGLSEDTLLLAGGLVQLYTDAARLLRGESRIGQGTPFTGSPFGHDPADQAMIRAGVRFFKMG